MHEFQQTLPTQRSANLLQDAEQKLADLGVTEGKPIHAVDVWIYRQRLGATQDELAASAGVSIVFVRNWELVGVRGRMATIVRDKMDEFERTRESLEEPVSARMQRKLDSIPSELLAQELNRRFVGSQM